MKHIKKYNEADEIHYDQSALTALLTKNQLVDIYQDVMESFDDIEMFMTDIEIKNKQSFKTQYLDDDFVLQEIDYLPVGRYFYSFFILFRLVNIEPTTKNMNILGDLLKAISFSTERIAGYKIVFLVNELSQQEGYEISLHFIYNFNIGK